METDAPLGSLDEERHASCRHCGALLTKLRLGHWMDPNGIMVCVKAPLSSIGQGRVPNWLLHEPMPAGLRGAPSSRLGGVA